MGLLDSLFSGGIPGGGADPGRSAEFGNTLSAIGMALASSPGNAPFQNLPQTMQVINQGAKSRVNQAALKQILMQAGIPEAQADVYARDETTAKLALAQVSQTRKDSANADAMRLLADPSGGGGAAGAARPTIGAPAGTPGVSLKGDGPTLTGDMGDYARAIQAKESGGNYGIVGPTHPTMGRALGAYQVMEANLPKWSQEAIGRVVSPDEFLKSKEIQDAIFAKQFGKSVEKYGNPQDAASVWFTGRPAAQGANSRDSLGTTGSGYVNSFNSALARIRSAGGSQEAPSAPPREVASNDPSIGVSPDISVTPPSGPRGSAPMPSPELQRRPLPAYPDAPAPATPPPTIADAVDKPVPVGPVTAAPLGPPPGVPMPRQRAGAPIVVDSGNAAENERQTQINEGRMGMYPPSVYGITPEAQAGARPVLPGSAPILSPDLQRPAPAAPPPAAPASAINPPRFPQLPPTAVWADGGPVAANPANPGPPAGPMPRTARWENNTPPTVAPETAPTAQTQAPAPAQAQAPRPSLDAVQLPPGPAMGSETQERRLKALEAQDRENAYKQARANQLRIAAGNANVDDNIRQQMNKKADKLEEEAKPTETKRKLIEAGYTPGTPAYLKMYDRLVTAGILPKGYELGPDGEPRRMPGLPAEADPNAAKLPTGYKRTPDGNLAYEVGGPHDPEVLKRNAAAQAEARARDGVPSGYKRTPEGNLVYEEGGPADPKVLTAAKKAQEEGKPQGKPLPTKERESLEAAGGSFSDFTRLSQTFKPDYGGYKVSALGEAAMTATRYTGLGNKDAADWWSDYQAKKNVIRNKLFGSALTATEKGEFDKANITPGMTPEIIEAYLERQRDAASRAAYKLANYHIASGRNPEEVEAAVGVSLGDIGLKDAQRGRAAPPLAPGYTGPAGGAPAPAPAPAQAPAQPAAPPARAIEYLQKNRNDPAVIEQFTQKYGPDAARSILGGR